MGKLNNLKPERVIKAFESAGWERVKKKSGTSHVKLEKEGHSKILSIAVHKGKDISQLLIKTEIKKAGINQRIIIMMYKHPYGSYMVFNLF
ncbi:MAG: type II toxin-antitoxin system HicA family toxin [Candidatus Eremiobacterota bacterium]